MTMASKWLHLANGADDWYAKSNVRVENPFAPSSYVMFKDGSVGHQSPAGKRVSSRFHVYAHVALTRSLLAYMQRNAVIKLLNRKRIAECTAYLGVLHAATN